MSIPIETLRQLLDYNPETGKLFWRDRPPEMFAYTGRQSQVQSSKAWNARFSGKEAFANNHEGYLQGKIFSKIFLAHRVIFAVVHDRWPNNEIDHINGVGTDNRISNIREVDHNINCQNRPMTCLNTSGIVGVTWAETNQKWTAQIKINRKNIYLGQFNKIEDAITARKAASIKYGFHPNHGRS